MVKTINDEVALLETNKTNLKNALIAKGSTILETDAFSTYPDKIRKLKAASGDAMPNEVLNGVTFTNKTGELLTGTIKSSAGATIIPSTSTQTYSNRTYITSPITYKGESDLVSSNIRAGIVISEIIGSANEGGEIKVARFSLRDGESFSFRGPVAIYSLVMDSCSFSLSSGRYADTTYGLELRNESNTSLARYDVSSDAYAHDVSTTSYYTNSSSYVDDTGSLVINEYSTTKMSVDLVDIDTDSSVDVLYKILSSARNSTTTKLIANYTAVPANMDWEVPWICVYEELK